MIGPTLCRLKCGAFVYWRVKKVGGQKRLQFHLTADDAEALLGDSEIGSDVAEGDTLHNVGLLAQQVLISVACRAGLKTVRDFVHPQNGHRIHLKGEPLCRQVASHQPFEGVVGGHAHHAVLLHFHVRTDLFAKEDACQRDVKGALQVKIVCHLNTVRDGVFSSDALLKEKDAVGMAALAHKKVDLFHLSFDEKLFNFRSQVPVLVQFSYKKYVQFHSTKIYNYYHIAQKTLRVMHHVINSNLKRASQQCSNQSRIASCKKEREYPLGYSLLNLLLSASTRLSTCRPCRGWQASGVRVL